VVTILAKARSENLNKGEAVAILSCLEPQIKQGEVSLKQQLSTTKKTKITDETNPSETPKICR